MEVPMSATSPVATSLDFAASRQRRIGVFRLSAALGLAAAIVFVVCWVGTLVPFGSPTHAYISLFTLAPVSSVDALLQGTLWSLLFGILSGAVFALAYNLFAPLERR
jgi:hypothetical protein